MFTHFYFISWPTMAFNCIFKNNFITSENAMAKNGRGILPKKSGCKITHLGIGVVRVP